MYGDGFGKRGRGEIRPRSGFIEVPNTQTHLMTVVSKHFASETFDRPRDLRFSQKCLLRQCEYADECCNRHRCATAMNFASLMPRREIGTSGAGLQQTARDGSLPPKNSGE